MFGTGASGRGSRGRFRGTASVENLQQSKFENNTTTRCQGTWQIWVRLLQAESIRQGSFFILQSLRKSRPQNYVYTQPSCGRLVQKLKDNSRSSFPA